MARRRRSGSSAALKCAQAGCNDYGKYQPLIRIRASIVPANGNDVLAVVRIPMTLCLRHKLDAKDAEIIATIPRPKMLRIFEEAKQKTGAQPNPDRTMIHWVLIQEHRNNG